MEWRPVLSVVVVAVALGGGARADEARAKQLYAEGEASFSGGRYAEAARSFAASFSESHHPGLLWNVGQSHHKQFDLDGDVMNLKRAAAAYQNYRELLPPGSDRKEVDSALAVVARKLDAAAKASPARKPGIDPATAASGTSPNSGGQVSATSGTVPTEEAPARRSRTGLFVGLGAGGALVVGGVALALGLTLGGKTTEEGLMSGNIDPGFQRISP